jgi:cardiolipin synthase
VQSTYAWLFSFVTVPVIGFLVYVFTGRGWKAFSQEEKLARNAIGDEFIEQLSERVMDVDAIAQRVAEEDPGSPLPNLARLVAHNAGSALTGFNELDILQDTDEFYPKLLEDLRQAQHHIHLQYFIWSDDDFTQQVKEILIERAQAGVKVRALCDAGNLPSKRYINELRDGGVEFYSYLAFDTTRTLHRVNYRGHRKITVIDGKIGYLGGMNLDREQLPGVAWPHWRDTQVRFHGEAALAIQVVFLAAWYNTTNQQITDLPLYFPDTAAEVKEFSPVQITVSGPDAQWAGIRQLFFYLIVSARKHCYIQSPFFIPDETIAEAMKSAALAGVDIRMICTPRGATYQVPYRAANTYFQQMAEAGVRIYLYDGGYYHAKTVSMDSMVCTIGSCNMDIRSYSTNYEINSVIYDPEKAKELEADFLRDLEDCTEFDLEEYNSRSKWSRFVDSAYRLASPLM